MIALQPLQGLRIMVTRPAKQATHLCELISAAGGVPVPMPVLEVVDPINPDPALSIVQSIAEFDIAIFISTNAVERGMALIQIHTGLPVHVRLAAVGRHTAEALMHSCGRIDIQAPAPFNSEMLLATPEMQAINGKKIVIFRGAGGRELLAETLRQRGAQVVYAEVYRRVKPDLKPDEILQRMRNIDIVIVSSQDGLHNLMEMAEMAKRREWLLNRQLLAISPRVAQTAASLGFKHPALTAGEASDEAMVAACTAYLK